MADHPNRHICEAIAYGLDNGWTLRQSGPRAHTWGLCPPADRTGCIRAVYSTPRSSEDHAKDLRRAVHRCPYEGHCTARLYRYRAMHTYDFTLMLTASLELTDDLADALFVAGCDDGTPGTCHGVFSIDSHRATTPLEEAMRSTIEDVRAADYEDRKSTRLNSSHSRASRMPSSA